jgi:hypothetical protein
MKAPLAFLLSLSVLLFTASLNSNAQFRVETQLRSRAEMRDGYQKLAAMGSDPAFLVSQRTRLSFVYESKTMKLRFTPQDVRLWGDQAKMSNGVGDNPSLDLFEAYAEISIGSKAWISAGRQQLVYDNRRLLGDRNWNQNGISYDALVVRLKPGKFNLHAGASWNTLSDALSGNPYPTSRIKSLNFVWLNRSFNNNLKFSLLHLSTGVTRTDTTNPLNFRHTTGIYSEYKNETINFWGNFYYQYGKNRQGNKVNAFLADADVSFRLKRFTPGLGFGYLSGNNKTITTGTADHLFDKLYGNNHRYFGYMDYFRSFATDTRQGGLADYYLWLDYRFSDKVSIRNIAHAFSLARTNPSTPADKPLGIENDLIFRFKFAAWGELENGYCFFLPSSTLETIQSVADSKFSQFFYVQLTLTPELFRQTINQEK